MTEKELESKQILDFCKTNNIFLCNYVNSICDCGNPKSDWSFEAIQNWYKDKDKRELIKKEVEKAKEDLGVK